MCLPVENGQQFCKFSQNATRYKNVIIPYLYKAQHVSGDTPPIIRRLKVHCQPLVFRKWKVVGRVVYELYYDARIHEHQVYKRQIGHRSVRIQEHQTETVQNECSHRV